MGSIYGISADPSVYTLQDSSDSSPALALFRDNIFMAWKGSGNDNLNMMLASDGIAFRNKTILEDTSNASPALASHDVNLYIAWKGSGNNNLNVAMVSFVGGPSTLGLRIGGLANKVTLRDTSDCAPALASHNGRLYLAWKGSGNDNLNIMFSSDNGVTFRGKIILKETSDASPALVSHHGHLFIGWKGSGNDNLNIARVGSEINSAGGFGITGLSNKLTLGDTSDHAPALASFRDRLILAWKGSGNDNLNMDLSDNDGASFSAKATLNQTSTHSPSLSSVQVRFVIAWKGSGNENLNVGVLHFYEV